MSLLTPRLGIKKPQDPDPFLTSDFQTNYDLLDSYPGVFVCTSGTKPVWTTAQAGQLIYCTDTKTVLAWTGTAWIDPLTQPAAWAVSAGINTSLTPPVSGPAIATYTLGTITSSRACNVAIHSILDVQTAQPGQVVDASYVIQVNGTSVSPWLGGGYGYTADTPPVTAVSIASQGLSVPGMGIGHLNAGSNTIAMRVTVAVSYYNSSGANYPLGLKTGSALLCAADSTST